LEAWPGTAYALDLSGHGSSGRILGGSYSAEIFAGDADAALAHIGPAVVAGTGLGAHIGPAVVAGTGLGAYVALLLAGGRPDQVSAALLLPGVGLEGGGPLPGHLTPDAWLPSPAPEPPSGMDPHLVACARDIRPPDYARSFGDRARRLLLAENGSDRPAWWEVLRDCATSESVPADRAEGLARLAGSALE
jgi:pimeloyl-ACP methyl ester carboxylesterase